MGPKSAKGKAQGDKESKKSLEKKTAKVVEDKTFGLKNKKGKKQQQFIQGVQRQQNDKLKQITKDREAAPKMSKKELEKQKLDELNKLFKPVQQAQKVADGVDPKSVLCAFFKSGGCQKGDKCKFSHDLTIERKSEKRNMYETEKDEDPDSMATWDQQQLEDVINKKHGESNAAKPKTSIICKHFLDAVEKSMYGWFWSCPTGEKCIYKHALPPGYVLKKDQKKEDEEDEKNKIGLEEHIENERSALSGNLTPVTLATFLVWKKAKIDAKKKKHESEMAKKKKEFAKGANTVSGRDIFQFKPELADNDDEDATADFNYQKRNEAGEVIDEEVAMRELTLESIALEAAQIDDTKITKAPMMSVKERLQHTAHNTPDADRLPPTLMNGDVNGLSEASGGSDEGADSACAAVADGPNLDDVPIDESLFEDLDDLEDLDIEDDMDDD